MYLHLFHHRVTPALRFLSIRGARGLLALNQVLI
jgi:hypothetical protein